GGSADPAQGQRGVVPRRLLGQRLLQDRHRRRPEPQQGQLRRQPLVGVPAVEQVEQRLQGGLGRRPELAQGGRGQRGRLAVLERLEQGRYGLWPDLDQGPGGVLGHVLVGVLQRSNKFCRGTNGLGAEAAQAGGGGAAGGGAVVVQCRDQVRQPAAQVVLQRV